MNENKNNVAFTVTHLSEDYEAIEIKTTFEGDPVNISFVTHTKNSRDGFNHIAALIVIEANGNIISGEFKKVKVHWVNRTWEKYRYQTLTLKVLEEVKNMVADTEEAEYLVTNVIEDMVAKVKENSPVNKYGH